MMSRESQHTWILATLVIAAILLAALMIVRPHY